MLPSLQFMQNFSAKEQCKRNRENYLHFIYARARSPYVFRRKCFHIRFFWWQCQWNSSMLEKMSSLRTIACIYMIFQLFFSLAIITHMVKWASHSLFVFERVAFYQCFSQLFFFALWNFIHSETNGMWQFFNPLMTCKKKKTREFPIHFIGIQLFPQSTCTMPYFFGVTATSMCLYVVLPFLRYAHRKRNKFVVFISKFT